MNIFCRYIVLFTTLTLIVCLAECDIDPVNATIDGNQPGYVIQSDGTNWRLDTRIPVAQGDLTEGTSIYTGTQYIAEENPPGEPSGTWTRQNTWYYPLTWTGNEEFWYGWMLLDIFSIDRSNHTSPRLLQSAGASGLFYTFRSDIFTAYYPPSLGNAINTMLTGTEADSIFGFYFRAWPRDTLVTAMVQKNSTAWNAGIRTEDRLLEFDGRNAATSLDYLNDTAGHRPVAIRYLRPATGEIATVTLSRSPCVMPTLFADTLPGAIGYIYISQFVTTAGLSTDTLFLDAAAWLDANSKGAWIFDLRNNGGGSISASQNILSTLLPRKSDLMCIRERYFNSTILAGYEYTDTMRTNDNMPQHLTTRSVYLLQNRKSASASEIVISSLRENLGSLIQTMGDTSYGKGIGQIYVSTPLGGYMAVTCMHIDPLRASSYHGTGIAPDTYFANTDSSINRAWTLALSSAGSSSLAKKATTGQFAPNFAALEWNHRQMQRTPAPVLRPRSPGNPFPMR